MIQEVSENVSTGSGWVMPVSDSLRVAQILDNINEFKIKKQSEEN